MPDRRTPFGRPISARRLVGPVLATCALFAMTTLAGTAPTVGATRRAVPPAVGDDAVISVNVGGDRIGTQAVQGLAGVRLGLFASATGGTAEFSCTSDVDGDCNFVVPSTGRSQQNRDRRFWVRRIDTAPAGWSFNDVLRTGNAGGANPELTPYTFQTGTQLRSTVTYSSSNQFMVGSGNTNRIASGGVWQLSRDNPPLPPECGLDIALVLDLSGSVSTSIGNLRRAADTFTDSLTGTPTRLSLFSFSDVSPATGADRNYPALTPVSTAAAAAEFKSRYAAWTPGGDTNWDRGLFAPAAATESFDLAVVITDGNPSRYNDPVAGPGSYTRFREVENSIFSANALKAEGTRIVVMAVSAAIDDPENIANLAAISGPVAGNGTNVAVTDHSQLANYSSASTELRNLALRNCTGTVSVTKQVVPPDTVGDDVTGAQPAGAGWEFEATTAAPGVGGLPVTRSTTADGTGAVNFAPTFATGTARGAVTVDETQQPGFSIVPQAGRNAQCRDLVTGATVTTVDDNSVPTRPGFTVDAVRSAAITCTLFNRAPQPPAQITVDKRWVIDGDVFAEGAQPGGFVAQLALTGPDGSASTASPWGTPRLGYSVGDTTTITETTELSRSLCTLTSSRLTAAGAVAVDAALPVDVRLTRQTNTFEITNVVTCESRLTLDKRVEGGSADPTSWTLDAIAPAGALPGPSGPSASTGVLDRPVTPDVVYQLAESGGDPAYAQVDDRTATDLNPLSTGSMNCVEIDDNGKVVPGFADGINGGVSVPRGARVRCTALNQAATLALAVDVENANGGSASPSAWTLVATPVDAPPGVDAQTITGTAVGTPIAIRPQIAYALSLAGPDGYVLTGITCQTSPDAPVETTTVTVARLGSATCTFSVSDQPAQLTLQTRVEGDAVGVGANPADWTLFAGPLAIPTQPIVSGNGDPSTPDGVSARPVSSGRYALSESGPTGFDTSTWQCDGAEVTDAIVVIPVGAGVTCTIVNTFIATTTTTGPPGPPTTTPSAVRGSTTTTATATPTATTVPGSRPDDAVLPATGGGAPRDTLFAAFGLLVAGIGLTSISRRSRSNVTR